MQRVKINDQFSSWMIIGVRVHSAILGLLLFSIFLCDMSFFCNKIDVANYADDNSPYCILKTAEEVTAKLEKSSKLIFEWFENNEIEANPDQCHLPLSKNETFEVNINENNISNTKFEKLPGVTFDNGLNFNRHISNVCKTASNEIHATNRFPNNMGQDKRRTLFNLCCISQFNYCALQSVTIHRRNIQALSLLMYNVVNNIAPTIVLEHFFFPNDNYD